MKADILGTEYTITQNVDVFDDEKLEEAFAYCDWSTKEIVTCELGNDKMGIGNKDYFKKKNLRHEIVHAFLHESGLEEKYSQDEELVDWIALQFPKMLKVFKEVKCL